jgi:diguanylate cyclase (GGDEF)-like protein/PAS domain S-box-containing protein
VRFPLGARMDHYHLATRGDSDGLWDWNLTAKRVHFAPRWVAMIGCEDHEVGHSPDEWLLRVHPEDRPEVQREIDVHLASEPNEFIVHHRLLHKNGTYRWMACHAVVVRDERGRAVRMIGSHADVTADTVADALTGLPNRLLFEDRLQRAIDQGRRSPDFLCAAMVLDLDRADGTDEASGDPLLTAAARRLETCLRSGDPPASLGHEYVVARLGGDRFAILVEGLAQVGEARVSAQRVLTSLLAPFSVDAREVFIQPSLGIAVSVTGYLRASDMLRDAETALHRARALGKARCEVFDTALLDSARAQIEMEAELEKAVDRRELVLYYQPIVSLASDQIAGFEALVRWRHPTRGLIPPLEFIPLAERSGLIIRIGAWVVREACRQLAAWLRTPGVPPGLWVSVNLSSVQFNDPSLFEQIGGAVRDAGLDPRCLMVELTEGTVMQNPAAARGLIMQLRVMGIRVGLDDFGTGHSSLAYLHQFPADFLKVDRSFIRGLENRQDMAEIVRTVGGLAVQLGLEVIAEGIELEEQLTVVRSLGCGYVQGFLLARPVVVGQAEALLKNGLDRRRPGTAEQATAEGPTAAVATEPSAGPPEEESDSPVKVPSGRRTIAVGLAAAALLVSVGVVVRFAVTPRGEPGAAPARTSVQSNVAPLPAARPLAPPVALPPPGVSPVRQVSSPPGPAVPGTASAQAARDATREAAAAARPPARAASPVVGPAGDSFPVVHLHVLGSCTGRLVVTPGGISFVPDKSKDGFSFPYQAILYSMADGALVIRSEAKTFRFKAGAAAAGEPAGSLQTVVDSIARQSRGR